MKPLFVKKLLIGLLFLTLFYSNTYLQAQDTGKLILNIFPKDAIIKIDHQIIELSQVSHPYQMALKNGVYPVEIWAPGRQISHDTIVIKTNAQVVYTKNISKNYTSDFLAYKKTLTTYNKKQFSHKAGISLLVLGNLANNYILLSERKKIFALEEEVKVNLANYRKAIDFNGIAVTSDAYRASLKKYNNLRKSHNLRSILSIPILLGSSYLTLRSIKKLKSNKDQKPLPFMETSPLSSIRLELKDEYLCLRYTF